MLVTINDEPRELPEGASVATVLELLGNARGGRGVAIAVDNEVVPRTAWATTALSDGAQVEVLAAVQGG